MKRLGKAFVVYQGSHGDAGASAPMSSCRAPPTPRRAQPTSIPRVAPRLTRRAAFPPGDAKEDWAILRALSAHVGRKLPYDSLPALRAAMYKVAPALARLNSGRARRASRAWRRWRPAAVASAPSRSAPRRDFYLTNPIARASAVMAELSALAKGHDQQGTTGTHG